MTIISIITTFALLAFGYILYELLHNRVKAKLPPGPKPWPLIGNITDLAPSGMPEYQHWLTHKDTYGPISSVTVLGQVMVILHDREAVRELMENKSLKTSNRPWLEFAHNLCGLDKFLSLRSYDHGFRKQRKFIHQQLGTKTLISQYNTIQEVEAGRLLVRLLDAPQNLMQHFKTEAAAIILKITYGYSIEPNHQDPLVGLIDAMMTKASAAIIPMSWPVDIMPALRYLPAWFPGASFQEEARESKLINQAVVDVPYTFVEQQMAKRAYAPSYVSKLIEQLSGDEQQGLSSDDEEMIKWSARVLYASGSDTTVSTLLSFVLAMLKFPAVQRKAQEEIDTLTGSNRLPRSKDREKLPYVDGVVKEALRWFPVVPMGLAHAVNEDIIFKGYLIPKGAIISPAIWWLLHDPQVYADPEMFDPARHLAPQNEPDPGPTAFGFGRRVCPGRYLADSSVFVTIVQMLATFNISKALDEEGNEIEPQIASEPGLIDHPVAFPYRIAPRSAKHIALIRKIEVDYPCEQSNASALLSAPSISLN